MNRYARKAWEVVGVTFEGSAYCPTHAPQFYSYHQDAPAPVFVSDDYEGMTCDKCGEVLR